MSKRASTIAIGLGFGAILFVAGTFGLARSDGDQDGSAATDVPSLIEPAALAVIPGASLDQLIGDLQARLEVTPGDYVSWATLGLAYVQQAKVTVNPDFYPRAEGALETSLGIDDDENFLVYAGLSALAAARHDFIAAKDFAERGLEINPYSALLYGALSDAEIQLGTYPAAFDAVQQMLDLSPDTASLSRASYTWELRGDIDQATQLMQRALDDAPTPADRAFALYYLGELAFNEGDVNGALEHYIAALTASPSDPAALSGRAKAEAALGQTQTALDHYAELVSRAPEPSYLLAYGELLESLGRIDEAEEQYSVFAATEALFAANGVAPDAGPILFYADHDQTERALVDAQRAVETHPFLTTFDAYAWALHQSGRSSEALEMVDEAMALGTRSALFHYHAGMIKYALGDLDGARADLTIALDINPHFSPVAAPLAQQTLSELGASA